MSTFSERSNRSFASIVPAIMVTACLLILMTQLIRTQDGFILEDTPTIADIYFDMNSLGPPEVKKNTKPEKVILQPPTARAESIFEPTAISLTPVTQEISPFTSGKSSFSPSGFGQGIVGPYGAGNGVVAISNVAPRYPEVALQRNQEGYVDVIFDITPTGTTTNIRIIESKPARIFDSAAIQAVRKWRYRPEKVEGTAIGTQDITQRITFELEK
ncbi:TonB family protein [Porticoccaceae bacterium LTM1]|nr:TonB family protein [Porticoccaceae bacterium LTM1]